jgi:hypothetical protein
MARHGEDTGGGMGGNIHSLIFFERFRLHRQMDRRNLSDAEFWRCLQWSDKRKERGGDHKSYEFKSNVPDGTIEKPSREITAELLGVSPRKVSRARTVMDHGDEETKG